MKPASINFRLFLGLLFVLSICAAAQEEPNLERGLQPYGSYQGGNIDTVDLKNGNVTIKMTMWRNPERGDKLDVENFWLYNGKTFQMEQTCDPTNGCQVFWNMRTLGVVLSNSLAVNLDYQSIVMGYVDGQPTLWDVTDTVQTSDGASFVLANLPHSGFCGAPCLTVAGAKAANGTGWFLSTSGVLYDGNGVAYPVSAGGSNQVNGPCQNGLCAPTTAAIATDPNGNQIVPDSSPSPRTYIDTLGRTFASSSFTSDFTGCTGPNPTVMAILFPLPGYSGTNANFKLCYEQIPIQTNFQAGADEYQANCTPNPCAVVYLLQSIVQPDSTAWTFEYNSRSQNDPSTVNYADLTKITFPTGGTLSYTWDNVQLPQCNTLTRLNRTLTSRTLDANDGTGPHTWRYSYSYQPPSQPTVPMPPSTTTVTDPIGNVTVHTFSDVGTSNQSSCTYYEMKTQYYDNANHLLKTETIDYGLLNQGLGITTTAFPTRRTTTLSNGLVTKTEMAYNGQFNSQGVPQDPIVSVSFGKVSDIYEYDYAQGVPGPLLRRTHTDYVFQNSSSYLNANFLNLPADQIVYDGAGTKAAETDYTYDESTYLTSSGISTQHTSPPAGVRGNPTTVSKWLNTANGFVTTHANWYDTGEVRKAIDALGNTTTYIYDSTGTYLTQTQLPDTSSPTLTHHSISGAYDFNTGALTNFTDQNGNLTTYGYDNMLRVTSAAFPDGGQIIFNYPDPLTVEKKELQNSDAPGTPVWIDQFAYFDGLGRQIKSQLKDPGGDVFTEKGYDALGRLTTMSNLHRSGTSSTDGVTTTAYDALGRVTKVTKQDGGVLTNQYNQTTTVSTNTDCTLTTDETGSQRKTCADGIGRLIEVDEPSDAFLGTKAAGQLNITGALRSAVVGGQPARPATATMTITGQEVNGDVGSITLTVGSASVTISYGYLMTGNDVAQSLASNLNSSQVTAVASNGTITFTAIQAGPSGNNISFSFSEFSFYGYTPPYTATPSSGNLSGGQNAIPPTTVYDSGTVTVTIGAFTASAPYGQTSNSTAAQVASALVSNGPTGLNRPGSPVTANTFAASVYLTYNTVGIAGNVAVNATSSSSNPGLFPNGSFSGSTNLSGGQDPTGLAHPFVTLYSYDALGNLKCAVQKGGDTSAFTGCGAAPLTWRPRSFTYDSLSRLTQAKNPESGTISYSYDADGNLLQKTSPAPNQAGSTMQTISFCYDALNRLIGKAYSSQACPLTSPVLTNSYDQRTNGIGRLSGVTDQAGSASYSYDQMGRVIGENRTTLGITKSLNYSYYADGSLKSVQYPSGATVTYTPDRFTQGSSGPYSTGRAVQVTDSGNSINYVTQATYSPSGVLSGFVSGQNGSFNGISSSFTYNKRLQPVAMSASFGSPLQTVFSINYDFHLGNGDNGNVWFITNNRDGTRSQTFGYDALNRITSAQNNGTDCTIRTANNLTVYWGNSYSYDAWGNLLTKTVTKCSAENLSVAANTNNQIHTISGPDYAYDAAGNMTSDATTGLNYTYNPENRLTGAAGSTYTYDGAGKRVAKTTGSSTTLYWYASIGIVAESDGNGNIQHEYIFFGGERVARKDLPGNNVFYYFADHLRSTAVITDSAGIIKSDSDYYPWGGELQIVNTDTNHYKFTGKERDTESGLDYFGARFYGNFYSRFISADRPFADQHLEDPQSWNLYIYATNNPLTYVDQGGFGANKAVVAEAKAQMDKLQRGDTYTLVYLGINSGPEINYKNTPTAKAVYDFSGMFGMGTMNAGNTIILPNDNAEGDAYFGSINHNQADTGKAILDIAVPKGLAVYIMTHSNGVNGGADSVKGLPADTLKGALAVAPNTGSADTMNKIVKASAATWIIVSDNDDKLKYAGSGHKSAKEWRKAFAGSKKVHVIQTFQSGHGAQEYFGHYHVDPVDPHSNDGWYLQPHPDHWPDPR